MTNVLPHEIAHSWSGNLVTNANFEHFWLNEGFTVFIERKIVGKLEGRQLQDFEAYSGLKDLKETVNSYLLFGRKGFLIRKKYTFQINRLGEDNPLTRLVVDLNGVHPDDAFSIVPYEKGATFLRYLENTVGGSGNCSCYIHCLSEAVQDTRNILEFISLMA